MSQLKYWVWLSSLSGVGVVTAAALLRHFKTPENVFLANANDYSQVEGIRKTDIAGLLRKDITTADEIIKSCAKIGCRVLTLQDAEYPDRLKNIYDPPITLYVRGNLPIIDEEPVVAMVGTRTCTPYGIKAAENISFQLARKGLIVTTGLAKGIDSAAARGAMRGGGRVIGVIGSGLDIVYPPENKELFASVVNCGAIISEYPPGIAPTPSHFPARNRILSGISLGTAVIEAPKKSGALITATRAIEQGRDVFAIPGNVDARSSVGSNLLIREGAIPILSADDIVNEYADLFPDKIHYPDDKPTTPTPPNKTVERQPQQRNSGSETRTEGKKDNGSTLRQENIRIESQRDLSALTGDEKIVAEIIKNSALLVDDIIVKSGLPAHQVLTALTLLEIKGYANRSAGLWAIVD